MKETENILIPYKKASRLTDVNFQPICNPIKPEESLQDRCCAVILQHLKNEEQIDHLELPKKLVEGLKDYQKNIKKILFFI